MTLLEIVLLVEIIAVTVAVVATTSAALHLWWR